MGRPVLVDGLFNVVITGVEPTGGCPADPTLLLTTSPLTSTVSRQDPPGTLRSGSNGEVIKIRNSSRVTVKFLNIRDGRGKLNFSTPTPFSTTANHDDGVDYKTGTGGLIFCNCVINNEEAIDVDGGSCNQVIQNLAFENDDGIRASAGTKLNIYRSNVSWNNGLTPYEAAASDPALRHNGLILSTATTQNNFENNVARWDKDNLACVAAGNPFPCCTGNMTGSCPDNSEMACVGVGIPFACCTGPMTGNCRMDDGIKLNGANNNCIVNNKVLAVGGDPNPAATNPPGTGACELTNSSNNKIDCNIMVGNVNKDGVTPSNTCRIVSGTGNTGSNVPGSTGGVSCSCPTPACTITPIP